MVLSNKNLFLSQSKLYSKLTLQPATTGQYIYLLILTIAPRVLRYFKFDNEMGGTPFKSEHALTAYFCTLFFFIQVWN